MREVSPAPSLRLAEAMMTDPIAKMIDVIAETAKGDLSVRLPVTGKDDPLDRLAGSINRLLETLQERAVLLERRDEGAEGHLRFLESMEQIEAAIRGTLDLDQMMRDVLDTVLSIFRCDRAWLFYPCDPDAPTWRVPMERTVPEYPGAQASAAEVPMLSGVAETLRTVLASDGPVQFGPAAEHPVPPEETERFQQLSQLSMAVYPKRGAPWMFGLHQCSHPRVWTAREQILLQEIGWRIADSLTNLLTFRELQESEALFRSQFELGNIGIAIITVEQRWQRVNRRLCEMLGCSEEELQQKTWAEMTYPDDLPPDLVQFNRLLAGEIDSYEMEKRFFRKDGTILATHLTASCFRKQDGSVGFVIASLQDITERKQAEAERAALESQLRQAQKMESIGRLAGGVAHDFNNMLSVILGYAELIKERLPGDHPLRNDVVEIQKAAGRSKDTIRQLLAFSRKQIIVPRSVDLNQLITCTRKTLARLIGEDIDLRFLPEGDLWKIECDPSQLDQILVNFAVNARDAMPRGGRLTIETANASLDDAYCREHLGIAPGEYVLLTVSDDGIGMDRQTLSNVFEPFFTTKEVGQGTGLGLSTVYGIVKQNDGFVYAYSEPGRGSSFKVYLPRSLQEDAPAETVEETAVPAGSGTVLLVEDDPMVREMTTAMLERIGYTVIGSEGPREALLLFERADPSIDLLITDVVMPEMNGMELRDRIQAMRPEVKVLFISGYTSNVIAEHAVLEEGVHFAEKPFTLDDLARKVREAITDG